MKKQIIPGMCVVAMALGTTFGRAEGSPAVITSVAIDNGQLLINWTGGRANFQLQTTSGLSGLWRNLGNPTSASSVTIPLTNSQAFFRVVADYTAHYQVVFHATWSQQTLPNQWPAGAHFSGLVGGTHNANVHFWRDGETASEGMRLMAERGQKSTLLNEIAPAIANGSAQLQLSGGGISQSPGSVSLTFPEAMTREFPLVTLVSMIAPSPDWFVGVDSLSLIDNGEWVSSKSAALYGRDAGTDSGVTFTSPDQVTAPRGAVTVFDGFPAIQDGVIVPFGTFTFTRLD